MISSSAVVETENIGENVRIDEFAVVRHGVVLGDNVRIHPHVVIEEGVVIGAGTEIFPGCYIGKVPRGAGATARTIEFDKRVIIGVQCAIGPHAVIFYDVEIGHNTLLGDGASLREQVRIGHHCLISRYVTVNYNTVIGDRTKIMDLTHITGNCKIGNDVFISDLVSSANDNVLVTRAYESEKVIGPTIENHATVGLGACLLPGIVIGEGAMIGAGSVVTKDVAAYHLALGTPARAVKRLASGETESKE